MSYKLYYTIRMALRERDTSSSTSEFRVELDPSASISERLRAQAEAHREPLEFATRFSDLKDYPLKDDEKRDYVIIMSMSGDGLLVRLERGFTEPGKGFKDQVTWERTVELDNSGKPHKLMRVEVWERAKRFRLLPEQISGTFVPNDKGELEPISVSTEWTYILPVDKSAE